MLKKLSLIINLVIIISAANVLFIYWYDSIKWFILTITSSIVASIIVNKTEIKEKIENMVIAWIMSIAFSTFLMCFPLLLWEENLVKINEALILTIERLLFITLIGLIISIVTSLFFSLILEEKL